MFPALLSRRFLTAAVWMAAVSSSALATPYAVTYTGTIQSGGTDFPEIINGQTYTVTFVFDNGGNTANSQTWSGSQLTCTLWRMNNARNVVYAQDLAAKPPSTMTGAATTDASGALTAMFTDISAGTGVSAGQYTASGFVPAAPVQWYANDGNDVFVDNSGRAFGDPTGFSGGVAMGVVHWSAPTPFSGSCAALAAPVAGNATAVPALGDAELALLSALVAGMDALRRCKRSFA